MVLVALAVALLTLVTPHVASTICYNNVSGEQITTNCTNGCCLNDREFDVTPKNSDICKPSSGGCPITNYTSTSTACPYYITTNYRNFTYEYDCKSENCCYDLPEFDLSPSAEDLCSVNGVCPNDNKDDVKHLGISDVCNLKKKDDDDFKEYACNIRNMLSSERCCHRNFSAWDDTVETDWYCLTKCTSSQLTISDTCLYKLYKDSYFTKINCYNGETCCEGNYAENMLPRERLLCYKVGSGDCDWRGDGYWDYYHGEESSNDDEGIDWWAILLIIIGIICVILFLLILCYTYTLKRHSIVEPEGLKDVEDVEADDKNLILARVEGLLDDAISSKSIADLKIAISEVESNGFEEELEEKYKLAKELLQDELDRQAKQAEVERLLDAAIDSKDPDALRNAISEVEDHGFEIELNVKYKQAKRLLEEADDRHTRLARVESMLDGGISSKDPADLQAAILETEKNGFESDLEEKYNLAKKALQLYYAELDEEQKRKDLEEAERLAQLEKERLEAAERELERLQKEKADAERIAEAQRIRDEANARWKKLWPRFMLLKSLKDLQESTRMSAEERAKLEAELAEKEKIRQDNIAAVREQLKTAINEKSIGKLRKSIKATEDNKFEVELEELYTEAKKLLERLERIQRVKKAVMELDRPLIAELRSFGDPPSAVYKTLVATYLLLGEKPDDLENWKEIVVMLGKTGKLSVKRRVQELEIDQIKLDIATDAKKQIHDLDSDTVYEANQAAAVFYEWADLMCDEAFLTAEESK